MRERGLHVLGEARRKDVLLGAELVPRLPHNRVDDIDSGNFVFGFALLDEFLDALHDVLVELDGLHCGPCDGGHLRLGDGRLVLVQARELVERDSTSGVLQHTYLYQVGAHVEGPLWDESGIH